MAKRKAEKRADRGKTGIVVAWREGETDLAATIESAAASARKCDTVFAVEDKDHQGPGQTRHRGIEAAEYCDVIAIIDAHMRFDANALSDAAKWARQTGGLACLQCYALENGAFQMDKLYSGARIVYKALDGIEQTSLAGKWSKDRTPGKRSCVMGGCYVFPREWYYSVGQPLAALPGWGGDEEILSIAAWLANRPIELLQHCSAHQFRNSPPWNRSDKEKASDRANKLNSRMTLIHIVVADDATRADLFDWQGGGGSHNLSGYANPVAERCRLALLKQPRTWEQWRSEVCEPDEINGVQSSAFFGGDPIEKAAAGLGISRDVLSNDASHVSFKPHPRPWTPNPVTVLHGVVCPHCRAAHDPHKLRVTHTYPNGNRRHQCPGCGRNFVSMFRQA